MSVVQRVLDLAKLDRSTFIQLFGGLYEHSPWIAEQAWQEVSKLEKLPLNLLTEKLKSVVEASTHEQKLTLLKEHPELAGKAATEGTLTAESTEEQSRARLDLCTPAEYEKFQTLNTEYNNKFGFPFIMAVRNSTRLEILEAFASRLHNPEPREFETALEQVHQIATLRLTAADLSAFELT